MIKIETINLKTKKWVMFSMLQNTDIYGQFLSSDASQQENLIENAHQKKFQYLIYISSETLLSSTKANNRYQYTKLNSYSSITT